MSATAILSVNNPKDLVTGFGNRTFHSRSNFAKPSSRLFPSSSSSMKPLTLASRFSPLISTNRSFKSSVFRRFDTLMEWQECKVKMKVEVPVSVAYGLYSERESIPKWMTFISSVKVLKDKPDLSRWTLKYKAFGQNLEYAWLAKNLQFCLSQTKKYTGFLLKGFLTRALSVFFPLGPSSCDVELTFAYEVPLLLIPFAAALQPLMQGLIKNSLEQFAEIAKSTKTT
ncbi:putative coenzyme Q-binding protein COQ10, START [Arabidopsis thaliana]